MSAPLYMTAKEAAEVLDISLATLYSYVSRGLIRSEAIGGSKRSRRYRREDVEQLQQRKSIRRNPVQAGEEMLHWGMPVMESGITLITDGGLYYRGEDALWLARGVSVEEVAGLIWMGNVGKADEIWGAEIDVELPESVQEICRGLTPVEAFQVVLPLVASQDLAAYDLRPERITQTGAKILNLMVTVVGGADEGGLKLGERLQRVWAENVENAAYLFNAAMILCADHELNVSAFTARCVASAGSTPYQVVLAGLAALHGVKHGGAVSRVEAFLREVGESNRARMVIGERLKRGEAIPGFGHRLYAGGDPRGRLLLGLIEENLPETEELVLGKTVVEAVRDLTGQHPTIDMGLAVLSRVLDLPTGGGIALFAMGRTIGWIGHAMEQYGLDQIIRPRARYVGESP